MATAEKRLANHKYRRENRDRLTIDVPKGKREVYKQLATEMKISVTQLIQYGVELLTQSRKKNQGDKLSAEQRQLIEMVSKLNPKACKYLIKFLETLAG